jgi:hypothetical protein
MTDNSDQGPVLHPQRGAKRRDSMPGVVNDVELRSQLEVRFATELEQRNIHWSYEPERIGAGHYLVDFYLPDQHCWVEVKGRYDSRESLLLPNVAIHLQRERGERLYLYMPEQAYAVGARALKPLSHEEFWAEILKPPEEGA